MILPTFPGSFRAACTLVCGMAFLFVAHPGMAQGPSIPLTDWQKQQDMELRRRLHNQVHWEQQKYSRLRNESVETLVKDFQATALNQVPESAVPSDRNQVKPAHQPKANQRPGNQPDPQWSMSTIKTEPPAQPLVPIVRFDKSAQEQSSPSDTGQVQTPPVRGPASRQRSDAPKMNQAMTPAVIPASAFEFGSRVPVRTYWQDSEQEEKAQKNQEMQQLISRGQAAFERSCTECHDADRALKKQKSAAGWMTTIRRMAEMDDANIDRADFAAIAAYLVSVHQPNAGSAADSDSSAADGASSSLAKNLGLNDGLGFNLSSTVSTLYRGADFTNAVENPGMFVDAWISMDFDRGGAIKGKVTVCTSCHSRDQGFTFELVEATAKLDLIKAFFAGCESDQCEPIVHAEVKAGRFVVPFGAIAGKTHPGIYRTLTLPLMFNMGRRVFGNVGPPRQPVLPMPFADEGINTEIEVDLPLKQSIKMDFYATNGLQDGPGGPFFAGRRYYDNNELPQYGGRFAIGGRALRMGASAMTGDYNNTGAPQRSYKIYGVDGTARIKDAVRFYFEYAMRDEESRFGPGRDQVYGIVNELEVKLTKKVSVLGRYDTLEYRDNLGPATTLKRFTFGINTTLPGGSTLIFNHEHWMFPDPQDDIDVVGARWVTSF